MLHYTGPLTTALGHKEKKVPETSSLQRYRARIEYLEQHIQLMDMALITIARQTRRNRHSSLSVQEAAGFEASRYSRLNHPVKHSPRLISYSKYQNIRSGINSLYRDFSEYLRGILGELYRIDPLMVVGKAPQSIQFQEVVKLIQNGCLEDKMIEDVFRKLENERSTIKLIERCLEHTSVVISDEIKNEAMAYLEMRHLHIHNGSKADQKYYDKYNDIVPVVVGNNLPANFHTISSAISAVSMLVFEIDRQLVSRNTALARQ